MSNNDLELDEFLKDEEDRDARARLAFTRLLDRQREKAGHIFALKANMGISESYIAAVPLSWLERKILFAADLPLFEGRADEDSKKVEVNKKTVDLLQQRRPDWRRQLQMSVYLAERENHIFPPLLVVSYQNWAYQEQSDNWAQDGRAIVRSIPVSSLDSNGYFLDIEDGKTSYYALDGQHRLMAIKGLKELITNRRLEARSEDGSRRKTYITLEEIIDSIKKRRINQGRTDIDEQEIHNMLLNRMEDEMMFIEIIPAVQKGETLEEAVSRLRQIFVDVNEQAKLPTKGDNILLDNTYGFRIVARHVMVNHPLLVDDKTMMKVGQLSDKSNYYTTLQGIVEIAENYLGQFHPFNKWGNPVLGDSSYGYIRPSEDEIHEGISTLTDYFNAMGKLPSHVRFVQASENNRWKLRAEAREDDDEPILTDNILFRPLAQAALAKAVGQILSSSEIPNVEYKKKLDDIFSELSKREREGMLKLRKPESPWFGILCDPIDRKMRRHKAYGDLCERMFIYLLHGMDNGARKDLREDFANARVVVEGIKGWSLDGDPEVKLEDIQLPNPWR